LGSVIKVGNLSAWTTPHNQEAQYDHPPPVVGDDHKVAKAKAAAAKAEAKAMRPWFKKKRILIPGILVLVIAAMTVSNSGNSGNNNATGSSSEGSDAATEPEADVLGIGDTATEDGFSFVVNGIECGIESVGDNTFGAEAQGQFCKVNITIENIGDKAEYVYADAQVLFDDQGREFSPDTGSMIYLGDAANLWFEEINPGNSVTSDLLYDVSDDFVAASIEVHSSSFSSGVSISLK
jgi:hypothetical protein